MMEQKRRFETRLSFLQPEEVEDYFEKVRGLIEEGIASITAKGHVVKYNADYIKNCAMDGDMLIAYTESGDEVIMVAALEMKNYVNYRSLFIRLIAGEGLAEAYDEWFTMIRDFAEWAGADSIEAACVPGLARMLRANYGFVRECEIVRLDLDKTKH